MGRATSSGKTYSYIMTVYDREPELLLNVIRSLSRCDLTDSEVIIVNDGSNIKYDWVRMCIEARIGEKAGKWIDIEPYEAARIEGGYNNPARAFNVALEAATGDTVVVMSSEVLVTPRVVERIRRFDQKQFCWTPMVIDIESAMQYCGPVRFFPAPWCLAVDRKLCLEIGGWDETYLKGQCYEDNDFMGRIMLKTGAVMGDWTVIAYHQSHRQPAYETSENDQTAKLSSINFEYTKAKWAGGIPFHPEWTAFDVLRKPHRSGDVIHECVDHDGLLNATIAKTTGLIADLVKA